MQSPRFERIFVIPPGIYAEGYVVFVFPFVGSSVRSLFSFTFVELTPKFMAKVSLSEYIFLTNQ